MTEILKDTKEQVYAEALHFNTGREPDYCRKVIKKYYWNVMKSSPKLNENSQKPVNKTSKFNAQVQHTN